MPQCEGISETRPRGVRATPYNPDLGLSHFGISEIFDLHDLEISQMAKGSAVGEAVKQVAQTARIQDEEVGDQFELGHGWTILLVLAAIGVVAYLWHKWRNR